MGFNSKSWFQRGECSIGLVFSALTFAATPLSNATQKTLPAFVGRPKMLIKKAYHLAIVAPVGKLCCNVKNGGESHDVDCQGKFIFPQSCFSCFYRLVLLQTMAIAIGVTDELNDPPLVRESVEEGRGHAVIGKDRIPLAKA